MYRNDRAVDPVFEPEEELYIRFNSIIGGKVNVSCLKAPRQSVNRSKYSKPEWVLITKCMRFLDWGYGYFRVENIPNYLTSPGGVCFFIKPVHKPFDDNYPHSEVSAFRERETEPIKKFNNRKTDLEYRMKIRNRIKILEVGSDTEII